MEHESGAPARLGAGGSTPPHDSAWHQRTAGGALSLLEVQNWLRRAARPSPAALSAPPRAAGSRAG